MKALLSALVVGGALMIGAGSASATVSNGAHALTSFAKQGTVAQQAGWRERRWHRWHRWHGRRHCWWRHGYRHCYWR
jgi:hypothetical protein